MKQRIRVPICACLHFSEMILGTRLGNVKPKLTGGPKVLKWNIITFPPITGMSVLNLAEMTV